MGVRGRWDECVVRAIPAGAARGQVGIELLAIIGFALVILIPFVLGVYSKIGGFSEQVAVGQADSAAADLANAAAAVSAQGAGASMLVKVAIPKGVSSAVVGGPSGREIVFTLLTTSGSTEVVHFSRSNLTASSDFESRIKNSGSYEVNVTSLTTTDGPLVLLSFG